MEYLQYLNSEVVNGMEIPVLNLVISGIPSIQKGLKITGRRAKKF